MKRSYLKAQKMMKKVTFMEDRTMKGKPYNHQSGHQKWGSNIMHGDDGDHGPSVELVLF